tara:strand:- start:24 stop:374 length:351 start_codon:yes stop_codon:yes gene_type:complete
MVELLVVLLYLHIQQLKYVKVVVEDMVTEKEEVKVDLVVVALDIMEHPTPLVEQVIGEMAQINQLQHQFLTKVMMEEMVQQHQEVTLDEEVVEVVLVVQEILLNLAVIGILAVQVE